MIGTHEWNAKGMPSGKPMASFATPLPGGRATIVGDPKLDCCSSLPALLAPPPPACQDNRDLHHLSGIPAWDRVVGWVDVLHDSLGGPPVQPPGEQLIPSWHISAMTALEFRQLPASQRLFSVDRGHFRECSCHHHPFPFCPPPPSSWHPPPGISGACPSPLPGPSRSLPVTDPRNTGRGYRTKVNQHSGQEPTLC